MQNNIVVKLSSMFASQWYKDQEINKMCDLETYVQDKVSKYIEVAQNIFNTERDLIKIQKECNDKKDTLRKLISSFQNRCDHPITSYHGDPSGNNDSYYECEICGKEL